MKDIDVENFLDWLVALDIQFFVAEKFPDYDPGCNSSFYLKGTPERFSSEEIIKIYTNKMDDDLNERWLNAVADYNNHNNKKYPYQKIL